MKGALSTVPVKPAFFFFFFKFVIASTWPVPVMILVRLGPFMFGVSGRWTL